MARRAKRQKLTLLFKKTEFGAPPFEFSVRFDSVGCGLAIGMTSKLLKVCKIKAEKNEGAVLTATVNFFQ